MINAKEFLKNIFFSRKSSISLTAVTSHGQRGPGPPENSGNLSVGLKG
jgi:hypothetical protein